MERDEIKSWQRIDASEPNSTRASVNNIPANLDDDWDDEGRADHIAPMTRGQGAGEADRLRAAARANDAARGACPVEVGDILTFVNPALTPETKFFQRSLVRVTATEQWQELGLVKCQPIAPDFGLALNRKLEVCWKAQS